MQASRRALFTALVGAGALLPTLAAATDTISGRLVGHTCAHEGEICPIDKLDPHITLEREFVLVQSDGSYYFLPNLPRDTKVRYALDQVVVQGEASSRYNSIDVDRLSVTRDGKERVVWSVTAQSEANASFGTGGYARQR